MGTMEEEGYACQAIFFGLHEPHDSADLAAGPEGWRPEVGPGRRLLTGAFVCAIALSILLGAAFLVARPYFMG